MCGIIFIHKTDNTYADTMVVRRYENQKNRGYQGFGYIALDAEKRIVSWKQAKSSKDIENFLYEECSASILFHHRFPTSTPNVIEATHPIQVSNPLLSHDYYLIHNGIIRNTSDMREKHVKMGFMYTTEMYEVLQTRKHSYKGNLQWNDSESLAIEVALTLDGKQEKPECEGSIAFICYKINKATGICEGVYFGRNHSNPLKLYHNKAYLCLASEGAGKEIYEHTLYKYDFVKNDIQESKMNFGTNWGYRNNKWNDEDEFIGGKKYEKDEDGYPRLPGMTREQFDALRQQDLDDIPIIGVEDDTFDSIDPQFVPIARLVERNAVITDLYQRRNFASRKLIECTSDNKEGGMTYFQNEVDAANDAIELYRQEEEDEQAVFRNMGET